MLDRDFKGASAPCPPKGNPDYEYCVILNDSVDTTHPHTSSGRPLATTVDTTSFMSSCTPSSSKLHDMLTQLHPCKSSRNCTGPCSKDPSTPIVAWTVTAFGAPATVLARCSTLLLLATKPWAWWVLTASLASFCPPSVLAPT